MVVVKKCTAFKLQKSTAETDMINGRVTSRVGGETTKSMYKPQILLKSHYGMKNRQSYFRKKKKNYINRPVNWWVSEYYIVKV